MGATSHRSSACARARSAVIHHFPNPSSLSPGHQSRRSPVRPRQPARMPISSPEFVHRGVDPLISRLAALSSLITLPCASTLTSVVCTTITSKLVWNSPSVIFYRPSKFDHQGILGGQAVAHDGDSCASSPLVFDDCPFAVELSPSCRRYSQM